MNIILTADTIEGIASENLYELSFHEAITLVDINFQK